MRLCLALGSLLSNINSVPSRTVAGSQFQWWIVPPKGSCRHTAWNNSMLCAWETVAGCVCIRDQPVPRSRLQEWQHPSGWTTVTLATTTCNSSTTTGGFSGAWAKQARNKMKQQTRAPAQLQHSDFAQNWQKWIQEAFLQRPCGWIFLLSPKKKKKS